MENQSEARLLNLGSAGYVLDVRIAEEVPGALKLKPKIVVILDRSGSMGQWCQRAATIVLPNALREIGYKEEDRIVLITFDTNSERVKVNGEDPSLSDCRKLNVGSRGSTNMVQVINLLRDELVSSNEAHHIIVLSDGGVGDQEATSKLAAQVAAGINVKYRVSCSLIRFMSSSDAQPDTRALTCVQLFANNTEKTALMDVSNGNDNAQKGIENLQNAIVSGCLAGGLGNVCDVEAVGGVELRSSPYADAAKSLRLACGQRFFLLLDHPVTELRLGASLIPVTDAGVPKDVNELSQFVDIVGAGLKMGLVAAGKNMSEDLKTKIAKTLAYFESVQAFLNTFKKDEQEGGGVKSNTVSSRAKALAKQLASRTASCIDVLRQQLNADRVAGLNAQQTADWLRGAAADTKGAKNLARRTEGADVEGDAHAALRALAEACRKVPRGDADNDNNVSFYSQSGFSECVRAVEELSDQIDSTTLQDWMAVVGGVGIPFEAFTGNYVDCWQFRVDPGNLFVGQWLAEPDLWLTYVQSQSKTASLLCPGRPDKTISGVVVLRDLNPTFYDLYLRQGRALAEMQCSAMMRKMVACVPHDVIAVSAASAWSLLGKIGALTTLEQEILGSLKNNLHHLIGTAYKEDTFLQLWEALTKNKDVRPFLTGDLNVTNILKCVATIIRYGKPGNDLRAAFRAMYQLEAYQTAGRVFRAQDGPQQRAELVRQLLGIDLAAHATPLAPLFEPEPENPPHYAQVVPLNQIALPNWLAPITPYTHLSHWILGGDQTPEAVFGLDAPLLQVVACVQAVKSANEADRVDTEKRVAVLPECLSEAEAVAYLKALQIEIYKADYESRVAKKKLEEHRVQTERLVVKLFNAATFDDFVGLIQDSPLVNREHLGYQMLLERIGGPDGSACPARLPKLALLITGRDISNEQRGPVWANGNFAPGDSWKRFQSIFSGPAEKAWAKILAFHEKYGVYKYPRGEVKNRHGHSDKRPSYWALGFKTLYDMKQKVSPEVFAQYVKDHGGDPNEEVRKPQTPQEKTDAKRARRAARAPVAAPAKGAKKGPKQAAAKAVPAKPAPSKKGGK